MKMVPYTIIRNGIMNNYIFNWLYIELVNLYIATEAFVKAEEIITYAENNLDDEIILKMREKTTTLSAIDATEADNENTNQ